MRRHVRRAGVLAVLAGVGVLAGIFLPTGSASSTSPHASRVTINVVASEWKFTLSKRTVPVGTTVVFKVTNKGKIAHDFKISGRKTRKLSPGKSDTLRVVLSKGNHTYICTIDSHAQFGMKGTFKST